MSRPALHLFEGFGVELEYMIVDAETLDVRPICDRLLEAVAGEITGSVDMPGGVTWSNELVLHVVELKATEPLSRLEGAASVFQQNVRHANEMLARLGARLMPSAMHPWMDPRREMVLWPHEYHAVYEAFHRIFDCRGHGWANLQSVHLNLPFDGDDEFGALHAAIRFLLPILPAIAASSPIVEGRTTDILDNRLEMYRTNSSAIPSIAGQVISEPVFTRRDYEEQILARIYADVALVDAEGVLRDEFLNARGAIARFGRGAIEIRLLDVQECPEADVALCALIVAGLRHLMSDAATLPLMKGFRTDSLHRQLLACIRDGENAEIADPEYTKMLGFRGASRLRVGEVWRMLFEQVKADLDSETQAALETIHSHGPLARRLLTALGREPSRVRLIEVYRELCACLEEGRLYFPSS